MVKVHRGYIFAAYFSLLAMGLADNIRGPLFPDLLQAFSLDNRQGSLFFSVASGMIIPGGYICGYLMPRWGRMRSLQGSSALLTVALLGIWASHSFQQVIASVAVLGFAIGMMGVAQNVMVIEASPPGNVQRWQAGLQSMYGLTSLMAPLLVAFTRLSSPSWQTPFLLAAGLSFLVLLTTFFHREKREPPIEVTLPGSVKLPESSRMEAFFYGWILASYVATEIMVSSHLAQYARDVESWDFLSANYLTSLFFVGMFAGRILFIFWHPPVSIKTQLSLSLALSAVAVVLGLTVHPLALALAGLTMAPFYPLCMTAAGKIFPRTLGAVASQGIALSGVTVVAMQTAVGFLADQYGLRTALLVGPGISIFALLMILNYKKIFAKDIP